ncbi:hypothetical protein E2542_SST08766 [Spatholobus suberectus]|nr:hypothetical protein E2542_SST08766 [Spatholobus suberectus]
MEISIICHCLLYATPHVAMDDRYSSAKFELLLRKGEDKVKIPNFFFRKWGNELSNRVLVEDNEGDLYAIDIHVEQLEGNAIAYFINGITDIRDIYCTHRTCLANFQFMGQSKFVAHMTPLRPSRNEDPASMPPPTVPRVPAVPVEEVTLLYWEKEITHNLMRCGHALSIPALVKKDGFQRRQRKVQVTLPDGKQTTWEILWYSHQCKFGHGWYSFCRGSNLVEGDVVIFQMLKSAKEVYVSIKKA